MSSTEVNVLGPLEVWVNERSIVPTANKLRQVLAMLAVHAGRMVTVPEFIEELWGMKVPRTGTQTIQTYILKLRQQIRRCGSATPAEEVLITKPGGYILDVPADHVDTRRYHDLAVSGEQALAAGDYERASRLLGEALDTWRGPALVDVQTGAQLAIEVVGLEQSRLGLLESRIEADLHLGRHHQLLGELAELTARYPLHEKLCTQYMTALHASGMKWRAFEVYLALRETMVRELGVEPSLDVRRLQRAILGADDIAVPQLVTNG